METIPKTDCENIGFFRKTHGIHGELVLEFEPHFEFSVEGADRFFVELEGLLVPFFLKKNGLRFRSTNSAIVTLNWVESEKYAKRLIGNSVYLYNSEIVDEPEETLESQFENYLLIDEIIGEIGTVVHVEDYAGNIVITVNYKGEEILIPYNDDLLISVNETEKSILLKLPEGLIEG
ncbi:MAG: 16S rRNA processing protein RimM [Draconibacterium sp.]|nr:16S rRNA processing protein RimM [Draconibacterium sp.]